MPEIPVGWEVKKLKFVAVINPSRDSSKLEESAESVVFLPMEAVGEDGSFRQDNFKALIDVQSGYTYFEQDDVLLAKITPCFENGKATVLTGLVTPVGFGSTEFHVIRPKQNLTVSRFLFYTVKSELFLRIGEGVMVGSAGQKRVPTDFLTEFPLPVPSLEEQEAVVQFLDDKTAQLDQLITQKQQMLELLREERAALINHVVTKGLDAAAPLRDSGVEWLGEVPAHWEVKRLKHLLVKMEQGWSPSCESRPAEPGEWGVLKVGCVNGLDFDPTENKALPSELTPLPEYEINPGDFLISRANTKELVGSAVVVGEVRPKLLLCDKIFRLFFRENANKEYVLLIISSWYGRFQIQSESSGASSSMQNISQEFLKNMLILLPDRHEQHAIVEYVAEQTSRILETTDTINQEIALLQEYRAALIAEAVTGQIDVRHYVPATVLT